MYSLIFIAKLSQSDITASYIAVLKLFTHCNMIPLIAGVMDPEFWFAKRSINFRKNVKLISNMERFGKYGKYSIMEGY